MDKFFNKVLICFFLCFAFIFMGEMDNKYAVRATEFLKGEITRDYTAEDIRNASSSCIRAVKNLPDVVTDAVVQVNAPMTYGEPIDQENSSGSSVVSVYAVGAGTVTSVGESEKIGKYIIISHGNDAQSVYGNLDSVSVKSMQRVKKGALIGMFNAEGGNEFYYTFSEL